MKLSKFDYYSDYVAYPLVIVALGAAAMAGGNLRINGGWLGLVALGFAAWTLLEYALHRIVLHGRNRFAPMHGEHHAAPLAFIGTPTWISLLTLGAVLLGPLWFGLGFHWASGLFVGVISGYVWYGAVHHFIHHRRSAPPLPYMAALRERHMRHHYSPRAGNFGVTTSLWDHVFGTSIRR